MKIKVTTAISNYDGIPLKENEVKLSKQLIMGFGKLIDQGTITTPAQILESLNAEIEKEPFTYRTVINNALNSLTSESDGKPEILSAGDKAKAYEITKKLFATKEPDFTDDQIEVIIKRVEKVYWQPVICGKIKEIFKK